MSEECLPNFLRSWKYLINVSFKFELSSVVRLVQPKSQYCDERIPILSEKLVGRIGIIIGETVKYPSHERSVVLVGREKITLHDRCLERI